MMAGKPLDLSVADRNQLGLNLVDNGSLHLPPSG
jgi:hypothetical protein